MMQNNLCRSSIMRSPFPISQCLGRWHDWRHLHRPEPPHVVSSYTPAPSPRVSTSEGAWTNLSWRRNRSSWPYTALCGLRQLSSWLLENSEEKNKGQAMEGIWGKMTYPVPIKDDFRHNHPPQGTSPPCHPWPQRGDLGVLGTCTVSRKMGIVGPAAFLSPHLLTGTEYLRG